MRFYMHICVKAPYTAEDIVSQIWESHQEHTHDLSKPTVCEVMRYEIIFAQEFSDQISINLHETFDKAQTRIYISIRLHCWIHHI